MRRVVQAGRICEVDADHAAQEVKITGCQVFVDPYKELVEQEAKQEAEAARKVLPSLLCCAPAAQQCCPDAEAPTSASRYPIPSTFIVQFKYECLCMPCAG